ncbi:MAG: hypothetical protein K5846_04375 [Bacteroidales bacterium]|nr:hypothetical protein [Bacteroidales bacterium]
MKKVLFLLGFFPTLLFGQPVTGLNNLHNQLVGGLPHGNWFVIAKVVDKDTILMKKTVYDMGRELSDTSYNFKTGKLIQTISYKDGLEDGVSKEYWPDGRLRGEVSYKLGVVDGFVKSYSAGGEMLTQLLYVNGEEDLNYPDRYLSDKFDYDTSYVGFNQPIWNYYAKFDTIIDAAYCFVDSLVQYYKNNTLYKENIYNYQRILETTTIYTNGLKDTVYDFYTKKKHNGLQCIYYYRAGKLTKKIYYDTKGRIFKDQKRGEKKALDRSTYRLIRQWRSKQNNDMKSESSIL